MLLYKWVSKTVHIVIVLNNIPGVQSGHKLRHWKADHSGRAVPGAVGSNPTRGMDVCVRLFCVCVVLWVGSGLPTGWSLVQGVLPIMYRIRKLKNRPMSKGLYSHRDRCIGRRPRINNYKSPNNVSMKRNVDSTYLGRYGNNGRRWNWTCFTSLPIVWPWRLVHVCDFAQNNGIVFSVCMPSTRDGNCTIPAFPWVFRQKPREIWRRY
jgi:hypothetical protein